MISLRVECSELPIVEPLVLRLGEISPALSEQDNPEEARFLGFEEGLATYEYQGFGFDLHIHNPKDLAGDVIMFMPGSKSAQRLIRASSPHNTLLVTEQCDQLCIMCSQPPKKSHFDLFTLFRAAIALAPKNATIGLSGGEPLLHKRKIFSLVEAISEVRPDVRFHILTNAQHFTDSDQNQLSGDTYRNVLWGIPIYHTDPDVHDQIVGKKGAFEILLRNLNILSATGAAIELRTVVLQSNFSNLPDMSAFIGSHLPFISHFAIMQLENIGFGRMNWQSEFVDTSLKFVPIGEALDHLTALGIEVRLFNFPLCTVPSSHRKFAVKSISDWKQRYLSCCATCAIKDACGGFFEWYPEELGFKRLGTK